MALISEIRKRIWLLVPIIAIAIVAFLFMDVTNSSQGVGRQTLDVATVNGEPISYEKYQEVTAQAVENSRRANPNMDNATRLRVRENAWSVYLQDQLVEKEMDELGVNVSNEEMKDLLFGDTPHAGVANEPIFQNQETKQFDPELLKNYIRSFSDGSIPDDQAFNRRAVWKKFETSIKESRRKQKYSDMIKKGIYVPKWQARIINQNKNTKVDIEYVKVPYTAIQDSEISFTDQDLANHLNSNKEKYRREESANIDYITFDVKPSDADKKNTENALNNLLEQFKTTTKDSTFVSTHSDTPFNNGYLNKSEISLSEYNDIDNLFEAPLGTVIPTYFKNGYYRTVKILDRKSVPDSVEVRHILLRTNPGVNPADTKTRIDSIYTAIKAGYDFEAAAAAFSEDPSNKEQGGELGWAKKGQMVPSFNDAIFYQLGKGEMTKVLTQFGWHIVQVTDIETSQMGVKTAMITKELTSSTQTRNIIRQQANKFAGLNRTASAFKSAAEEAGYKVLSATSIPKKSDYSIPQLGTNEGMIAWAFKSDEGAVSNVYDMDDKFVIAALTDKKAAGMPSVEDVRLLLEIEVKKDKKAEKLVEQMNGKGLDAVVQQYNQSVQTAEGVSFDQLTVAGLGSEPAVQAVAGTLEKDEISKPIIGNTGVFVIKANKITKTPKEFDFTPVQTNAKTDLRRKVDQRAFNALKEAAEITDTRFETLNYQ